MSSPLKPPTPSSTFPCRGATAYTSPSGPIHALRLEFLNHLRASPDYESCMPTLITPELATDWDAHYLLQNPYRNPPTRNSIANPLRVFQTEIHTVWDPYKLAAMIRRSHQDLNILRHTIGEVHREAYDEDRILDDAQRKQNGGQYPHFWTSSSSASSRSAWDSDDHRHRRAIMSTRDITPSWEHMVHLAWDVYKLREVFSSVQADVAKLVDRLADTGTELRRKVLRLDRVS